ncbi:hypothetical protein WV31_19060 [Magnetospirillum sp. ME-1]|nr:hypothetical protein WV31_19060 [Magnetospirillum sp. ME-1]
MALPGDKLPWRLTCLLGQLSLLLANPVQFGDSVCASNLQASHAGDSQGDAAIRRVNRKVDILDVFARHRDAEVAELYGFHHP